MKKRNQDKQYRYEVMVKVTDQWYPNYPDNHIKVGAVILIDGLTVRVNAWGDDDLGMDRDYLAKSHGEARGYYRKMVKYVDWIKTQEPVNQEFFKKQGFEQF